MTRQEYEAELADLQSQIDELKKVKIEDDLPKPPHPRWKPELGDIYYTTYCVEDGAKCHWIDDSFDKEYYSLGFVCKTKAEAEFDAERLKVLAEMREWAGNWNDAVVLTYSVLFNKIEVGVATYSISGEIRFANFVDAKNCIKSVGEERLKKYYFMIPEDEA